MRIKAAIIVWCLLFLDAFSSFGNGYLCPEPLKVLENKQIFSICQCGNEIMLNTSSGLYQYDAYSLQLADKDIVSLNICSDNKSNLFYATKEHIIRMDSRGGEKTVFNSGDIEFDNKNLCFLADDDAFLVGIGDMILTARHDTLFPAVKLPNDINRITSLCASPHTNNFLCSTSSGELIEFDLGGNSHLLYSFDDSILSTFIDSSNNIWIGFDNSGILQLTPDLAINSRPVIEPTFKPRKARTFAEVPGDAVYVGSLDGLFSIREDGQIKHEDRYSPKGHAISSICSDNSGNLWLGTFYSGIYVRPTNGIPFENVEAVNNYSLQLINAIAEDKDGNVWIATDHYGLYRYSLKTGDATEIKGFGDVKFKCAQYDPYRNKIWTGEYLGPLSCYDIETGRWETRIITDKNGAPLPSISIYDIAVGKDELFIGTNSGVFLYNPKSEKNISRKVPGINSMTASLFLTSDETLWISSKGLWCLKGNDLSECIFKSPTSSGVLCDRHGLVWLATDDGIISYDGNITTKYNYSNCGLPLDNFYYICDYSDDCLVIGTSSGLCLLNTKTRQCLNYGTTSGLMFGSGRDGNYLKLSNGAILFGGTDGLVSINTGASPKFEKILPVKVKKIVSQGRTFWPTESRRIDIRLQKGQSNLDLVLSDYNYTGIQQPFCEYYLEGLSKEWIQVNPGETLHFFSLQPLSYSLHIRSSLYKDSKESVEECFNFRILPVWYKSTAAIIVFILLLLVLLTLIFIWLNDYTLTKQRIRTQEKDSEDKMRFFIKISHELRTPLTLIIGQLEHISQDGLLDTKVRKNIVSSLSSAKKMKKTVSDLLDFEKSNHGYSSISVRKTFINAFLENEVSLFADYALIRKIDLSFAPSPDNPEVLIDSSQMHTVISNLLSNSFKFTPDLGCISVSCKMSGEDNIKIRVADTGRGISEDAIKHIFDPFFQDPLNEDSERSHGTGIGLALSRAIILLHHGTISAFNSNSGGAIFEIILPCGTEWIKGDDHVMISDFTEDFNVSSYNIEDLPPEKSPEGNKSHPFKMLIIEDNDDLRNMLISIFNVNYNVIDADNGAKGYAKAVKEHPDIILSDIMMPVLNGFTLCEKIKENFETCHIPVILLTAHDSSQNVKKGINSGADDYITKPFDVSILEAKCRKILENRETLRKKFSIDSIGIDMLIKDKRDETFLNKAIAIIEKRMSDPSLSVGTLCDELAMGRTSLSEKMSGLTGMSPRDFIEDVKLKKAASMLKNSNMRVADVSYEVGFSSPKYFSLRFHKKYGMSPSKFQEDNK